MTDRLISVIVPNYNGEKTISLCLKAIYQSSCQNFEVIVVDDASTDESREVIRKFDCQLISLANNRGPAYARNAGAAKAKAEILVFVDSDVCLPRDALEEIKDIFDAEKNLSAVVGMPDKFCKFKNITSQHFNLRVHFNYLRMPKVISILYGSICSVRKKAFLGVSGFDTRLKKAGIEDNDLGYRLTEHGYKIRLNKKIQINHYKKMSFLKLLKNDFWRSFDRIKLMLRKRKFKTALKQKRFISTPLNQIYSVIVALLVFLSFLGLHFSIYSAFGGLLFLLWFYFLNKEYLVFLKKEKGYWFAMVVYFLLLVDMLTAGFGIAFGLVSYLAGQKY